MKYLPLLLGLIALPYWSRSVAEQPPDSFTRLTERIQQGAFGEIGRLLVLDGGKGQGREIVSEEWIRHSTTRHRINVRPPSASKLDYVYTWWRLSLSEREQARRLKGRNVLFAWGADGQFVFALPEFKLVVFTTGGNYEDGLLSVDLLLNGVIPALFPPVKESPGVRGGRRREHGIFRSRSPGP